MLMMTSAEGVVVLCVLGAGEGLYKVACKTG